MGTIASRSMRLALAISIAVVALLASRAGLRPSIAIATGCVPTPAGSAVFFNPSTTVTGTVNATGCQYGVVYDSLSSGGTINGATIFGASADGVLLYYAPASITIKSSNIRNNGGDGVDLYYSSGMTLTSVKISANGGDGLHALSVPPASVTVSSSAIYSNANGSGVYVYDADVEIDYTSITGNGNGVYAECLAFTSVGCFASPLVLKGDSVLSNGQDGIYAYYATVRAYSSNFSLNAVDGLFLDYGATVYLTDSKTTSNQQAGAYLPYRTPAPYLKMTGSAAQYNSIGIDIESEDALPAAVDLTTYSRVCSNKTVDLETDNASNWSADATSKVCAVGSS
jgi:hypothetical protein